MLEPFPTGLNPGSANLVGENCSASVPREAFFLVCVHNVAIFFFFFIPFMVI